MSAKHDAAVERACRATCFEDCWDCTAPEQCSRHTLETPWVRTAVAEYLLGMGRDLEAARVKPARKEPQ